MKCAENKKKRIVDEGTKNNISFRYKFRYDGPQKCGSTVEAWSEKKSEEESIE
jgi:hypothetical protein